MATEIKNIDFIKQKLNNFIKFCRDQISIKSLTGNYLKKLEELENVDINHFVQWIIMELKPYKDNLHAFVVKTMEEANVKIDTLTKDEYNKIVRYLQCFIDYVS